MRDAGIDHPREPGLAVRAARFAPRGHGQVWLVAAGYGLIFFLAMAVRDEPLLGVAAWVIAMSGYGAAQSFRLSRSRRYRPAAGWAPTRLGPPPGS